MEARITRKTAALAIFLISAFQTYIYAGRPSSCQLLIINSYTENCLWSDDFMAPIRHQLCRLRRERTVARPVSRRHCFLYEALHFFRAEQILSGPVFLSDGTGRHLCDMAPEGAA